MISLISELSGTSAALLESSEFLEMFLPMVRQDFQLCDEYNFIETIEYQLPCPVAVFRGENDSKMPFKNMAVWINYTHKAFDSYVFSGGHFFIREYVGTITEIMMRKLQWQ